MMLKFKNRLSRDIFCLIFSLSMLYNLIYKYKSSYQPIFISKNNKYFSNIDSRFKNIIIASMNQRNIHKYLKKKIPNNR